jgi:endonuclease/exonuclease/phosphatase family metal-dependent hydrolase
VLGVQEALDDQAEFVAQNLGPHYDRVGRGRDADGTGESCPVFFDTRRVQLMEWTQLALSDTPRVAGSRTWGNHVPRVVVWALFRDLSSGTQFRFLNTHFDHQSRRSRVRSAELILRLVDSSPGPAIVTGDFNSSVGTSPHHQLTIDGSLRDAWVASRNQLTKAWGTYPNYHPPKLDRKRIDWILVNRWVDVGAVGINTAQFDGIAPSDHLPVQAVVTLRG